MRLFVTTPTRVAALLLGLHSLMGFHPLAAHALAHSNMNLHKANNRHHGQMRRILVTDDNGHLGRTICKRLLVNHPHVRVVLAGRDRNALGSILDQAGDEYWARLEHIYLDFDCDASVDMAAHELALHVEPIHGIIYAPAVAGGVASKTCLSQKDAAILATCEKQNPYLGLRRATRAFLPLLQPTKGRWINVISEEAAGLCFSNQLSCKELDVDQALKTGGPEETALCSSAVQAIVSQLDHVSQTYAPFSHENALGFSQALVSTYSALLAKLQDPDGARVQLVTGNDPQVIIDACMKDDMVMDNDLDTVLMP